MNRRGGRRPRWNGACVVRSRDGRSGVGHGRARSAPDRPYKQTLQELHRSALHQTPCFHPELAARNAAIQSVHDAIPAHDVTCVAALCMASGITTVALGADTPVLGGAVGDRGSQLATAILRILVPVSVEPPGRRLRLATPSVAEVLDRREASLNGNLTGEQFERVPGGANQL